MSGTILNLLSRGAGADTAIGAPEAPDLGFDGLRKHVRETIGTLRRLGIGRNDRVAIVLPNGPDMASAFVSVAAAATTAPLNPAYRDEEFEFYLGDLNAKALIVDADGDSPHPRPRWRNALGWVCCGLRPAQRRPRDCSA